MKKGIAALLAVVLAAGAGSGAYYQFIYKNRDSLDAGRVSSDSEDAVYVDSVSVLAGLGNGSGMVSRFAGVIEPEQTWSAKLENEKTVAKTYVKEGDKVKVGDKLFSYKTDEDEEKLAQTKIDVDRAKNEMASTQLALEKARKNETKASQEEKLSYATSILTYETDIKRFEYDIKSKEEEIAHLEESIKSADVLSELDGIVKSIKDVNSQSSYSSDSYSSDSGSDAYITIMTVGSYRVKANVNEQNISDIYQGQQMLAFSRVDGNSWKGTITEIKTESGTSSQQSDTGEGGSDSGGSTSYPFYVELEQSDGLMLGQHVFLEPDNGQADKKEGIWIPEYYFELGEDKTALVWAASKENVLEHRSVKLGEYDEKMMTYQVLEGLDAEDYITTPADELKEGLPVSYVDYDSGSIGEDVYGNGQDGFYEDGSLGDEMFDDGSYMIYYDDGSQEEEALTEGDLMPSLAPEDDSMIWEDGADDTDDADDAGIVQNAEG